MHRRDFLVALAALPCIGHSAFAARSAPRCEVRLAAAWQIGDGYQVPKFAKGSRNLRFSIEIFRLFIDELRATGRPLQSER